MFDTLMVFLKEFFEKFDFETKSADNKKHVHARFQKVLSTFFFIFFSVNEGRKDPDTTIGGPISRGWGPDPLPPSGSAHDENKIIS